MIVGWMRLDHTPAVLIVSEELPLPCRVDVLVFTRLAWRTVWRGRWDVRADTLAFDARDAAFEGEALDAMVLEALREWRADAWAGTVRYGEADSAPALAAPAALVRVGAGGWLRRLGRRLAASWRAFWT